jgi:hypothetical protein
MTDENQHRLNALLAGKKIQRIERLSQREIVVFFAGGAKLFIAVDPDENIELSVTGA